MPTSSLVRQGIDLKEYHARRASVLKALDGAAAVVFSGELLAGAHGKFTPDPSFFYLTGIPHEPGAAVLFNPQSEDPRRRIVLFLKPIDPEMDRWERYRDMISEDMKSGAGFDSIMRTAQLPAMLTSAARRCKRLACLHSFTTYSSASASPDLSVFRRVQERVIGVGIEDRTSLLATMRGVKSKQELALMGEAARATKAGFDAVLASLRPGANEGTVARTLESAYIDAGAEGTAYDSICGCGLNATLLHYRDNAAVCKSGDLLLIDSGARFAGYACDVTRTIPVSGRFTPEQREVYAIVLKAMHAAIKAARPGAFLWQVDKAARDVINAAGYADAFMHGTSHHLGLEVHDITPDGPLKPGMVITIEPGVYLPEKNLGIRIEDSVVIGQDTSKSSVKNLTASIPKEIDEIEHAMMSRR